MRLSIDFPFESKQLSILLLDIPDYASADAIAQTTYDSHQRLLNRADLVVVRPPVDKPLREETLQKLIGERLIDRSGSAALHVLYSKNYEICLSRNLNPKALDLRVLDAQQRGAVIDHIRQYELAYFAQRPQAMLQAHGNYWFRAPSGGLVKQFLRVGSLLTRRSILDAYVFWLLPALQSTGAILVETWSISPIGLLAVNVLGKYDQRSQLRMDMLSHYHDSSAPTLENTEIALRRVIDGARGQPEGQRQVLVLTSASATGQSMARLKSTADTFLDRYSGGEVSLKFVTMYKLANASAVDSFLCDLAPPGGPSPFEPQNEEVVAALPQQVVEIDRYSFFPVNFDEKLIMVRAPDAKPAKDFFREYAMTDAVSIHRDHNEDGGKKTRHHAFYVDVRRLLQSSTFCRRIDDILKELVRCPVAVIVPPHAAGRSLASYVVGKLNKYFGCNVPIYVDGLLENPNELLPSKRIIQNVGPVLGELIRSATEETELLVLDDVSVRGGQLQRYQEHLRRVGYKGHITYMVGVARPDDKGRWLKRKGQLAYRGIADKHAVRSVEELILPDWEEDDCPWCQERRLLSELEKQAERMPRDALDEIGVTANALDLISERISRLDDAKARVGLEGHELWSDADIGVTGLTSGSILIEAPAQAGASLGAVAATLQRLRDPALDNSLKRSFPFMTVLDPENYLGNRFNDPILRVGVIRGAFKHELCRWALSEEKKRKKEFHDRLQDDKDGKFSAISRELAISIVMGKLPTLSMNDPSTGSLAKDEVARAIIAIWQCRS